MSRSFDITPIILEIVVGEEEEQSQITAFRHRSTNKELNFGMVGQWLCDVSTEVEFPKEIGHYRMNADWNDESEVIECIYDVEKID